MTKTIFLFLISCFLLPNNVFAFVNCQSKYDTHPRALNSFKGKCNVCHISPNGSGPQNDFGKAFKVNGFKITNELVAQFPDFFQKEETTPIPTPIVVSSPTLGAPSVPPILKRIKPNKFKINIQSMATIIGKNFTDGAKAFIDGNEVVTSFKSNVKLVIDFILNTVGIHQVKVENSDGQESNEKNIKTK